MKKFFKIFMLLISLTGLSMWGSDAAAAPPAWQASSAIAASTGADVTVTLPAHQANDILLLQVLVRDVNDTISWPAGWTQIATADRGTTARYWWAWSRAASSAEPNPLVNKSTNNGDTYAAVTTYRGAITTGDPWEVIGTPNTSTVRAHVLNGITTLTADSLIVASLCGENNSAASGTTFAAANPATLAQVLYVESATGADGACTAGAAARTTIGATGNVTATWTNTLVGSGGIVLALKPLTAAVTSINTADANPTNAASVSWTVTFDKSVTGVDASAFSLVPTGLSGAFITTVTGSGTTWTVTANTGIGVGTLGLNQTGPGSVVPTLTGTVTGQVYTITATPALAEYRMDEASWNGTAGEVVDSSGNGNNAQAFNSTNTDGTTPAIAGSPGTCRYGVFDNGTTITQGYVQTPLPNLTTDFTVTAWIRTTNNTFSGQRILIDDQNNSGGYGFSLGDGTAGRLRFYSRGITQVILDSTYTIANNSWYFVAAVADITNKMRTIYVFNSAGALLNSTTEAAWTGGAWGTDTGTVSIGGEVNGPPQTELPVNFHFHGNLDEVRVYQKVLSQNALAEIAAQTHPCASLDHYEMSLPTSSVTCLPTTVTVTACADASSPCTNPLTAATGTTANLATSGGTLGLTTVTFSTTGTVSTTLSYPAAADGTGVSITLSGEQITATNNRQCCPNGTSCVIANSCSTTFNTTGFIFSSSAGGMEAPIPTQVAGTSSGTYYLRAIKSNTKLTTATQACEAALTGANTVNFAYECNNPTTCYTSNLMSVNGGSVTTITRNNNGSVSSYTPVNMTFDANGNAPFTLNYSDVGLVTLWAAKPISGLLLSALSGSSNAFVVKPGGFVLSNIVRTSDNFANPVAANAAGTKFVKAGEAFSATVTAVTSIGSTAYNYGKENSPEGVTLTTALVTGLGLTNNPALANPTAFGAFTNGVATGTTFNWPEVGIIKLTPSVGDSNYLGAGEVTGTPTGNIGRFYPDHFAITSPSITAACSTGTAFSYFGQDGFTTTFTLTAQNTSNGTTANYAGNGISSTSWAKLPLTTWAAAPASAGSPGFGFASSTWVPSQPAGSSLAASAVAPTAPNWSAGTTTVTAKHQIVRSTAPAASTTVTVTTLPVDSDGVTAAAATAIGSPLLRFGRLRLSNAFGSEKVNLQMPVQAQYWGGNSWVINSADGCTNLLANAFYLVGAPTGTSASAVSLTGGAGTLTLTKPSPTATGVVDVAANLGLGGNDQSCLSSHGGTAASLPWLRSQNGSCAITYDHDPSARATFGIYAPETRKTVHVREQF